MGEQTAQKSPKSAILFLDSIIKVPALPRFVGAEKVRAGETIDGIRVITVAKGFMEFLRLNPVEEPTEPVTLRLRSLSKGARDAEIPEGARDSSILLALDGGKAKITLGQFWWCMQAAHEELYIAFIGQWTVAGSWNTPRRERHFGAIHEAATILDEPGCDWPPGTKILSY